MLSISPDERFWACASGTSLQIFDTSSSSFVTLDWDEEENKDQDAQEEPKVPAKKRKKRGKTVDKRQLEAVLPVTRFVAFSTDSKHMATGGDDKILRLWDCQSWKVVSKAGSATVGKKYTSSLFVDNKQLLAVDKFGDVTSYSVPALQDEKDELGHFTMVSALVVADLGTQGKVLVSSDTDGHIRVSDLSALYDIRHFCLGQGGLVGDLCLVDKYLVSGGEGGALVLWDPATGQKLASHTFPFPSPSSNSFIPYVSLLRSSSQGILVVGVNPFNGLGFYRISSSPASTRDSTSATSSTTAAPLSFELMCTVRLPNFPLEARFLSSGVLCVWLEDYPMQFFTLRDNSFELCDPPSEALRIMRDELKVDFEGVITNLEDFGRRKADRIRREQETRLRVEANKEKVRNRLKQTGGEPQEAYDDGTDLSEAEGDDDEER